MTTNNHIDPQAKYVSVTPKLAEAWLAKQVPGLNRNLSPRYIDFLAKQITEKRVDGFYQPIIFHDDRLLDGQHRLHAIVKAGVAVNVMVLRGVPVNAMPSLDTGRSRSGADVLSMFGAENARGYAAIISRLMYLIEGVPRKVPNDELLEFFKRHTALVKWGFQLPSKLNQKKRNARLIAPFVFAQKTAPDAVSDAANVFFHDEGLKRGQPLHTLHVYVNSSLFAAESRGGSQFTSMKTLLAIRATLDNKSLARLMVRDGNEAEAARQSFLKPWSTR